ncbi:MAG: metallophosphoesterase [bacterium]
MKIFKSKIMTFFIFLFIFFINIANSFSLKEFGFDNFYDLDKKFLVSDSYNQDDVQKFLPLFQEIITLFKNRLIKDNWLQDEEWDFDSKKSLEFTMKDLKLSHDFIKSYLDSGYGDEVLNINKKQNNYVQKIVGSRESNFIAIGDIHGNYNTLSKIISSLIKRRILNNQLELLQDYYIFFLGDVTDRGPQNLKILTLIMLLMVINQDMDTSYDGFCRDKVFFIRGNHENIGNYYKDVIYIDDLDSDDKKSKRHSLIKELENFDGVLVEDEDGIYMDYPSNIPDFLNKFIWSFFNLLPVATYFKVNQEAILLTHGGWAETYESYNILIEDKVFAIDLIDNIQANSFLWDDIRPIKDNILKNTRGDGIKTLSSRYVLDNINKGNTIPIKTIIKGHDHIIPKWFYNKNDDFGLKEFTPGFSNIGSKKFLIIVTIAGPVESANYNTGYVEAVYDLTKFILLYRKV